MNATKTIELTLEQLDIVRQALNNYQSAKEESIREFRANADRHNDKDFKRWNKEDTEEFFVSKDVNHLMRNACVELRYVND